MNPFLHIILWILLAIQPHQPKASGAGITVVAVPCPSDSCITVKR